MPYIFHTCALPWFSSRSPRPFSRAGRRAGSRFPGQSRMGLIKKTINPWNTWRTGEETSHISVEPGKTFAEGRFLEGFQMDRVVKQGTEDSRELEFPGNWGFQQSRELSKAESWEDPGNRELRKRNEKRTTSGTRDPNNGINQNGEPRGNRELGKDTTRGNREWGRSTSKQPPRPQFFQPRNFAPCFP